MPSIICDLPNLTIANGGSTSNAIRQFDDANALTIYTPATLSTTIYVEVCQTSTGTTFVTLQSGGTDVTLPAGKATILNKVGWRQIRVVSAGTEGQTDTFGVTKTVPVG